MARYCYHCTFLEGVSIKQHEEFQISLTLCVQFSKPVAKIYVLSYLQSWNFLYYRR